jgi:type IV secretory pathway VirJ component
MPSIMPVRCVVPLLVALAFSLASTQAAERTDSFGRFKDFRVYTPDGGVKGTKAPDEVVLFLSGDGGWDPGGVEIAEQFVRPNTILIGVDTPKYFRELAQSDEGCVYPPGDFESLAQYVEKSLHMDHYIAPILAGYSSGATLAYAAAVQAPKGTFQGTVSLGFCPDLAIPKPMCKGAGLTSKPDPKFDPKAPNPNPDIRMTGVIFDAVKNMSEPWIVLQGETDQVCLPEATKSYVGGVHGAMLIDLPRVGHGFAAGEEWAPQLKTVFQTIEAGGPAAAPPAPAALSDLPLYEVPASGAKASDWLAVFYTGDGGWAELDREVSSRLAARGVPVVGISSLRYFWSLKPPDDAAVDLGRIIHYYAAAWHKRHILLVGYSFGADVIPAIFNHLPEDVKRDVGEIGLIGPSPYSQFEIKVGGWVGHSGKGEPTQPEIETMSGVRIVCIHGSDERDSLCPNLNAKTSVNVPIDGGHHFGGDFDAVSRALLSGLRGKT